MASMASVIVACAISCDNDVVKSSNQDGGDTGDDEARAVGVDDGLLFWSAQRFMAAPRPHVAPTPSDKSWLQVQGLWRKR